MEDITLSHEDISDIEFDIPD